MITAEKNSSTSVLLPSAAWAIGATGLFWVLNALSESLIFGSGPLLIQLIAPPPEALIIRVAFAAFAFILSFALHQQLFRSTTHYKTLLTQQQKFNSLIKKSTDITLIIDDKGTCHYVSPSITEILGYNPSEIVNKTVRCLIYPKHMTRIELLFQRAMLEQSVALPIAMQVVDKWGDTRHVEGSVANMLQVPSIEGLVISLRDVTARVDAEEARDQIQSKYKNLFLKNEVAIWEEDYSEVYQELKKLRTMGIINLEDYFSRNKGEAKRLASMVTINEINQATLALFNAHSRNDFIWHISEITNSQSIHLFKGQVLAIWNKQTLFQTDATYKTLNGKEIHVHLCMPIPDKASDFRHIPISRQDITDRKNAEKALQRSQHQLAEAQRLAKLGSWEWNVGDSHVICSKEAYRILGYDIAPDKIHQEEFLGRVHPADRNRLEDAINIAVRNIESIDLDYRVLTPEGHCRTVKVIGETIVTTDGKVSHMVGTLQDVTKQRQNENRMMLANRMFEHTKEGIFITDKDTAIIAVNHAFSTMTGYAPDEAYGNTPKIFHSGKQGPDFYKKMWAEIKNKGSWQGKIWNQTKQGQLFSEWLTINEVKDEQQQTINYIGTFSGTFKAKQTEEQS